MVNYNWRQELETTTVREKRPPRLEELEEELPLHKRWKSLYSERTNKQIHKNNEFAVQLSEYNPLTQPSPLGLQLKKSSSLLNLIQKNLSQGNKKDSEKHQVGNKKEFKSKVGTIDKLKAANFPAEVLKIGEWKYVSQHEGDLVAKCYFAKHKLVWEVLDGGLKNKIEIEWHDIVGLKANCPDNGPGTLTVLLCKTPLFFKETNPQPRKHTLWESTLDFTDGQASKFRTHYLQCAQGIINKHYEKLIQYDTRLSFLGQQSDTIYDLPFVSEASNKAPDIVDNNVSNQPEMSKGPPNPEVKPPMIPQTKKISDLVNHIGHCISNKNYSRILPLFENLSSGGNQKDKLHNISEILLSDSQFTAVPDETKLISRINSLGCLIRVPTSAQTNNNGNDLHDGNDAYTPHGNSMVEDALQQDWEEDNFDYVYGFDQDLCMARKHYLMGFLHQFPEIGSPSDLVIDISEDDESPK